MMGERYKVIEESQLGHGCCFSATVVDTTKNSAYSTGENPQFVVVCEAHESETAHRIAKAMNDAEEPIYLDDEPY